MNKISDLKQIAENYLSVPAVLKDYQWEGINFLYSSHSALLADEMGLGKTVQTAVALALLLNNQNDISRALVVSPASLTHNWMLELKTWAPSVSTRLVQGSIRDRSALYMLPVQVLVISYEHIRIDGLDRIPSETFDLVVLDEAQRIKNKKSTTSLACRLLHRKRSWALSATPLENSIKDVSSILNFLNPSIVNYSNTKQFTDNLHSIMLRRKKSEVREELPPVIIQDIKFELTDEQKIKYLKVWSNRFVTISKDVKNRDKVTTLIGIITKLKIICNYVDNSSSKLDALNTIIDSSGPSARILVFSQFVKTLKWIAERISISYDLLTGEQSKKNKKVVIENFKSKATPHVLLVSLRAGGVGLNLGEATHVVLFDRWWNPAVEKQAIFRAHRFEREDPLHVIRFLILESIEERIATILEEKEHLFDNIVDSTETASSQFTQEEMMEILKLKKNTAYIY